MKLVKILVAAVLISVLVGCASIAGDNTRSVRVDSFPRGADIYIDNQKFGVTPAVVTLPSYIYGGKSIAVKKTGFQSQARMVNTKFQPIALLNLFFTPGFIIDAATGDLVKIDPADLNLHFNLTK